MNIIEKYLIRYCIFCGKPEDICKKHEAQRRRLRDQVLDSSIVKGCC